MPKFLVRTNQRQTASYEYEVAAADAGEAERRVLEGKESGSVVHIEYDTESIESTEVIESRAEE